MPLLLLVGCAQAAPTSTPSAVAPMQQSPVVRVPAPASASDPAAADSSAEARAGSAQPTCRTAVANELRLLLTTIRADAPQSTLADGLERFARKPVITRDTVAALDQVRTTAQSVAAGSDTSALERAAQDTASACQRIDTPEQQAQDAVDELIALLVAKQHRELLERFYPPVELRELRRAGSFDEVLRRFDAGWGDTLLGKLRQARQHAPEVNEDGSVSFHVGGELGPMSHPVTLVEQAGRWYVRE